MLFYGTFDCLEVYIFILLNGLKVDAKTRNSHVLHHLNLSSFIILGQNDKCPFDPLSIINYVQVTLYIITVIIANVQNKYLAQNKYLQ